MEARAELKLSIESILGGPFWGMVLTALIRYLATFTSEPLVRWLMVVPAFCLSAVQTVFVCAWTYKQLIQEWGQLSGLIKHGFMIYAGPLLTGTVMVIVQAYYVRRLYALRQEAKWILVLYALLIPAGWVLSVLNTYSATKAPRFANFYNVNLDVIAAWEAQWKPLRIAQAAVNVATDVSICFGMLWTLFKAKTKVRGDSLTRNVVGRLIRLVMDTMLLPTIVIVGVTVMYLIYGDADGKQRLFSYPQTGINVFSLLHTLLARQSLRQMVDSQATPSLSIHLTEDIPGGRYERAEDRAKSRATMQSPGAGIRLARRTPEAQNPEQISEYLSDEDVEKGVSPLEHRRERPISTQRSLSQCPIGNDYDDRIGARSVATVSYEMDKFRIHTPPNVYQPLDDATLRANAPGLERQPTFYQEVKAIKLHHQMKKHLERRQSWD